MANITPFDFNGQSVRVIDHDGELFFVANDVCEILGYSNARKAISDHVDEDDVTKRDIIDALGRMQSLNCFNESGLYSLTLASKKPEAKPFKKWVTSKVLPSIRKTGSYGSSSIDLDNPSHLKSLLLENLEKLGQQEKLIEEQKPKADFVDQFVNADGLYGLQNCGRAIGCSPNKFVRWLKQDYMFYQGGALIPRAQYVQQGIFEVKSNIIDEKARPRAFVTPKGVKYFAEKAPEDIHVGGRA